MLQHGAGMQIQGRFPLQVTMVTILKSQPWLPETAILTKPNTFGGSSGSPLYTPAGKLHGLHFAGSAESDTGCHLAHQTVKAYVEDARRLIIDVSELERAHLAQLSPISNDPELAARLAQDVQQAAVTLLQHAVVGNWDVVVRAHLQPAVTQARQQMQL